MWLLYSYIVSILHALTLVTMQTKGMYSCEPSPAFKQPQEGLFANTWVTNDWCIDNANIWEAVTVIIFLGYLTVDLLVCILKIGDALKGKYENYAHHLIGIFGTLAALIVGRMILSLSNATCLTELSTPFVSLRGILYMLKKSDGSLYLYNGLAMTAMFFISRNVFQTWLVLAKLTPAVLYRSSHMFAQTSEPWVEHVCWASLCLYLMLCVLNFYWFYRMVLGAISHASKSKSKKGQ